MSPPAETVVGVAGLGRRARLLSRLIQDAEFPLVLWAGSSEGPAEGPEDLGSGIRRVRGPAELAAAARLIFVAVPADRLQPTARQLGDHLRGYHRLVHATRGFDPGSGRRPSEVLRSETPVVQVGALMGPFFVAANTRGRPGSAVVASRFPKLVAQVQEALGSAEFRIYGNRDLVGAEIAAAGARVLAVAVGIADGMDLGPSVRATLITRGVAEVARIAEAAGGTAQTCFGLAGLGDLIVRVEEPPSPECELGRALAGGASIEDLRGRFGARVGDLRRGCHILCRAAAAHRTTAHIFEAISRCFERPSQVADHVGDLLSVAQMME